MVKFQNTNPERGRKLGIAFGDSFKRIAIFQNTNPERGRKPALTAVTSSGSTVQFQNTNPERGRKHPLPSQRPSRTAPDFRTQTPNGDGNTCARRTIKTSLCNFRTQTPKGDGNLQGPTIYAAPCWASLLFQNTNPERGRKHTRHKARNTMNCC